MRTAFLLVAVVTLTLADRPWATSQQPPAKSQQDRQARAALLEELRELGAYESTYGRAAGAPLHVMFRDGKLTDADLEKVRAALVKSPVVVSIGLNNCRQITDAGLAHLKDVATIRELVIENRSKKITDDGLKVLATLPQLEELSIFGDAVTDASLESIGKLTKLRKLQIFSKGTTKAGYKHLAGLVNLEEIYVGDIGSEIDDECLQHMKAMTKLKKLDIRGDKLTDTGMDHVKNLTGLQELRIDSRNVKAAGVANLAPLVKLQKLTVMSSPGFTGEALAALSGMTELKELDLIYTPWLDKTGSLHLGKLKNLKRLRLSGAADGGLEGLAGLTALESLDMNYARVKDADLQPLSGLKNLQYLDIQNSGVSDAGLKHLAGLPKLRHLSASGNKGVTDASLSHLAGLPNLEILSLSECKITGTGFKDLAKLTKLKELWINGNPVTDEHVPALKEVRSLKEVAFTGTKVSEEASLELKKARPALRVRDLAGDEVSLEKKPEPKPKKPVEDLTKVKADFTLTAEAFHKEVVADQAAAAKKYKDKVIELTGEVDGASRNISGDAFITLKVEKQLIGVMCATADPYPWAKAVKGQKITIKGRWPEFAFSAAIINCAFVETGEYQGIAKTADELAKEWAKDSEAVVKNYEKKHIILSGEVAAKEFNSAGAATITFKTDEKEKAKVKCSFTAFDKDAVKRMKIGEKIKVLGEFTLNFAGGDEVQLYFCLPMPK